jgi:hypothetical protein
LDNKTKKKNPKLYHGTGCLRIVFGNKLQKWRISVKKITVKIYFCRYNKVIE